MPAPLSDAPPATPATLDSRRRRGARPPPLSLFWRTLILVLVLLAASGAAWVQSFRVLERGPRAQQIAQQMITIVNLTRKAVLFADPIARVALLTDLAEAEGIRVVPLEDDDKIVPFPDIPVVQLAQARIIEALGPQTRVAAEVDGVAGVWVSFDIDADDYWLFMPRDPLARDIGTGWIGWAVIAAILSLAAAITITRVINRPLARLAQAARRVGTGVQPEPLPEQGPAEIRTLNASFNRMVQDLAKLEQDRAVLLAGVSHDLRTPLTRLRLELDINPLAEEARAAMISDIEQIDAIVTQFMGYAKCTPSQAAESFDLRQLLHEVVQRSRLGSDPQTRITQHIDADRPLRLYRVEVGRALENLLTNADRYGRDAATGMLHLELNLQVSAREAMVEVADHGPGLSAEQRGRVRRPFERGETARSDNRGAGLGLAIVDRVALLHGGHIELLPNQPHGLRVRLRMPAQP